MNINYEEMITAATRIATYREALATAKKIGNDILKTYKDSDLYDFNLFVEAFNEIDATNEHIAACIAVLDRMAE